uniref:non-specific serine/threonine protein kinase n=2 Tax=Trichobilharzia regenti TaxID=157069 RepID=A0AA85KFP3_TRIRE|nr:unnamed protein product [Trichobilharzia regenti]
MEPGLSELPITEYQFIKTIGKGSYGEVWLCRHNVDRKHYVIKKIDVTKSSDKERKAAKLECKLLSEFKHPNIVQYKASFEYQGFLYIAMGFCEGGDLYTRLRMRNGSLLPERLLVEWFVQLAIALQYMHERNVLHRDLKTRNIFLTRTNIVKLGDLGIARVLESSSSMATTLIGTPYYMSPELFANKPYNHKSDIWALGCVLYEMTTLRHAFNAKNFNALSYKILSGKIPDMPTQYSPELLELMRTMLHLKPEKRPSARRVLANPFIRKHIILFLEATKDRTNLWSHSSFEDEEQTSHQSVEYKRNDSVVSSGSSSGLKAVTEKTEIEVKHVKAPQEETPEKCESKEIPKENIRSILKDSKQVTSVKDNLGSGDKNSFILPSRKSEGNDMSEHNILKENNLLGESNGSAAKSSSDTSHKCSQQDGVQFDGCLGNSSGVVIQENSLPRRLSNARLRRRQRRRMSENDGEQHNGYPVHCKQEHQVDRVNKSSDFNEVSNTDENSPRFKFRECGKLHSHSFSVLPVSMLPKLRRPSYRSESDSSVHSTVQHALLGNGSTEFSESSGNSRLPVEQVDSSGISSSPAVLFSSPPVNHDRQDSSVFQCNSTSLKDQSVSKDIRHGMDGDNTPVLSRVTRNVSIGDQQCKSELCRDQNIDKENDVNKSTDCHQNSDMEIAAVVDYLADTLKDDCHPGAPVIIRRSKSERRLVTVDNGFNICSGGHQKSLTCSSEDNGPIEPKEETINRSVHLKQRFVELHRSCM